MKIMIGIVAATVGFVLLTTVSSLLAVLALFGTAGLIAGVRARRWQRQSQRARQLIADADVQHRAMCRGDYRTAFYGDVEPEGIDGKITWCTPEWVFDRPAPANGAKLPPRDRGLVGVSQPDFIGRLELERS